MNFGSVPVAPRARFSATRLRALRNVRAPAEFNHIQILWPQVLAIVVLLLGAKAGATPLFYALLIFWALRSHVCALQALTFSFLLGFLNPAFFPGSGLAGALRLLILGAAIARIFFDAHTGGVKWTYTLWALAAFSVMVASSSLLFSSNPTISILKVLSFSLGVAAILMASQLNRGQLVYWQSWFFTLFLVVLCLSIPTYLLHSIGFAKNGRGFQGILNHPQAFAVFLCPLTTWLSCVVVTREKTEPLFFWTLLLAWFSLFASQGRTALLSVILGVFSALLIMSLFQSHILRAMFGRLRRDKRAAVTLNLSLILGLGLALVYFPNIQQGLSDFMSKGDDTASIDEQFHNSRGFLIERSWENFQENPLVGIGFGVPSEPNDDKGLGSDAGGIAVSAPTEKGFLPSAALEENGVLGTIFLVIFMGCLLHDCLKRRSFANLCLFLTCIFVNIGEMIFFSLGGVGLFMWLLMGLALIPEAAKPVAPTGKMLRS